MDDNQKFWDRTAKLYTALQERGNPFYETAADRCAAYLQPQARVLELACGTGQFTRLLCGRAGSWEAGDFSPRMVAQARKRNIPGARFSVLDATDLACPDGSFQVVLIANALHIMPQPQKALREIHRVLAPGGILLAPTFVYEGRRNRLKLWLTEKAGFRTFSRWTCQELSDLVAAQGFSVLETRLIPASPVNECFLAAKRI